MMMVEWKSQCGKNESHIFKDKNAKKIILGSRFLEFNEVGEMEGDEGVTDEHSSDRLISSPRCNFSSAGDAYDCSSSSLIDSTFVTKGVSSQKRGLRSITIIYFNPFEDTGGAIITLNDVVLDLGKHSMITFKENIDPNKGGTSGEADSTNGGTDSFSSKSRGGKGDLVCIG
ncbi:hypothetical protein J1N35_018777 [Gossypium stocksii]|uniref:Uncharacterized protein n=1 Tax=Gossypium stocksii TaxID=47602 RepID=A0A9D3VRN9_9ROSI|nr:hypothetical protein J1N35_018777 [Gossypium stocksii]